MNLYTIFFIYNIVMTVFSKNIEIKSGLEMPIPWSVGLRMFTEIKNSANEDYSVEVHPERCCLDSNDSKCDIITLLGSANGVISGGATKTLTMVAPLLDPYSRRGVCTVYVDSGPVARPKNHKRETIKIKFNTKIKNSSAFNRVKLCKHIDEDPLNNCNPVDCDIYYNGKRSYFSLLKKRCVEVPACTTSKSKEYNLAYNPTSNRCVHEPSLSQQDINHIKELTQNINDRVPKHVTIIKVNPENKSSSTNDRLNDSPNTTETSADITDGNTVDELSKILSKKKKGKFRNKIKTKQNLVFMHHTTESFDSENPGTSPCESSTNSCAKKHLFIHNIVRYCAYNKYAIVFLAGIILMQCFLICTLLYCITKTCCCFKRRHTVNRIFNNRQDMTVTTPLIGTSNVDTDTTDYQYLSESSNYIDKKIKCYKACQKERKNNAKLSMSDDILSKCITRRDWRRLPMSETIQEINNDDDDVVSKHMRQSSSTQKKVKDMKVNFQEEYPDKQTTHIKSIVKKDSRSKLERYSESSEQELRCHSYNYNNVLEYQKSPQLVRDETVYNKDNKKASGAQVYFSNDSIDDFMSERGVMFVGDNASRYSFTSMSSATKSTSSSRSSKTSKNNIVKSVITLLSRKAKGPSSDPGVKTTQSKLDLELLHLSRATTCSSSNETDVSKRTKQSKESTSSF